MVRVTRFQSPGRWNGITGWMLSVYCVSWPGPDPKLKLCCIGTLMMSGRGFFACLARSVRLRSACCACAPEHDAVIRRAVPTTPARKRPVVRTNVRGPSRSRRLEPGLRLVEEAEIAANLQGSVLDPHLGLVDLAVFGIHDRAALVAISAQAEVFDDDEPDDGLVLVGARALGAHLRLALFVVRFGETGDLAEELAPLLVHLHLGPDLAALLVDRLPRPRPVARHKCTAPEQHDHH